MPTEQLPPLDDMAGLCVRTVEFHTTARPERIPECVQVEQSLIPKKVTVARQRHVTHIPARKLIRTAAAHHRLETADSQSCRASGCPPTHLLKAFWYRFYGERAWTSWAAVLVTILLRSAALVSSFRPPKEQLTRTKSAMSTILRTTVRDRRVKGQDLPSSELTGGNGKAVDSGSTNNTLPFPSYPIRLGFLPQETPPARTIRANPLSTLLQRHSTQANGTAGVITLGHGARLARRKATRARYTLPERVHEPGSQWTRRG